MPELVSNIKVNDLGDGNVELSWVAPTKGKNGGYVDPQGISYYIYNIGGKIGTRKTVNTTSFKDKIAINKDEQKTVWYVIEAFNKRGSGDGIESDTIFIGDAYKLPYKESFSRRNIDKGHWGLGECETFKWTLTNVGVYTDPQDSDGGMVEFRITNGPGGITSLVSPKLSLSEAGNPTLSFYVWHHADADNRLKVFARTPDGQMKEIVFIDQSNTSAIGEQYGWVNYTCNLSEFRTSDYVQIIFTGTNISAGVFKVNELFLDNITVVDVLPYDLDVKSFDGEQQEIEVGEVASFWVLYENKGYNKAENYTIRLLRDGKEVAAVDGEPVNPSEANRIKLTDIPNGDVSKSCLYTAVIDFDSDDDKTNNTSAPVVISVLPGKPYVNDLTGKVVDSKVVLSWTRPVGAEDGTTKDITEGFEDYEAFIIRNIGEWTLNDVDKCQTAGIQDGTGNFVDYPNVTELMAFQVLNPSKAGIADPAWMPHSGNQVLAAFTCGYAQNDNWIISPALDGKQTISFWARSPENTLYRTNEVVEVLYSTTGKELTDFKKVGNTIIVPASWTRYEIDLPEGVKFFAIHCISKNQYVLFIDDISFRAAARNFSLTGYNVYRDDNKLNSQPITDTSFTDAQADLAANSKYHVTAVYNIGESVPSNIVDINGLLTGLNGATYDDVTVQAGIGTLSVSNVGNREVKVLAADGRTVHTAIGDTRVRLHSGVYIVSVDNKNVKVLVR